MTEPRRLAEPGRSTEPQRLTEPRRLTESQRLTESRRLVAVTIAAVLLTTTSLAHAANTPLDRRDDGGRVPGILDLSTGPADRSAVAAPISANPLWAIPLSTLRATRERPLFRPSRRPPNPVIAAPIKEPVRIAAPALEPDHPPLRLVGIVVGADDGFAVFINNMTRDIIPMKTGEGYGGWVLRSVKGREAVLEKGKLSVVIDLPDPAGEKK